LFYKIYDTEVRLLYSNDTGNYRYSTAMFFYWIDWNLYCKIVCVKIFQFLITNYENHYLLHYFLTRGRHSKNSLVNRITVHKTNSSCTTPNLLFPNWTDNGASPPRKSIFAVFLPRTFCESINFGWKGFAPPLLLDFSELISTI
jgi:hypothetical protein